MEVYFRLARQSSRSLEPSGLSLSLSHLAVSSGGGGPIHPPVPTLVTTPSLSLAAALSRPLFQFGTFSLSLSLSLP